MSRPITHDGDALYRWKEHVSHDRSLQRVRPQHEHSVQLDAAERISTLADYLGVGTGELVAEWHVVMPDGSLQPALTWRAGGAERAQ